MKTLKKVRRNLPKLKSCCYESIYCHYLKSKINPKLVFLESRNGNLIADNILRLCIELQKPAYKINQICISVNSNYIPIAKKICCNYEVRPHFIVKGSFQYYRILATSKYLITDTTFPYEFVKRDGQIIINTWHGTPIKKMGRYNEYERFDLGNVQRSFLMSDYIICNGECLKERLSSAYMLNNQFSGKFLMSGSPRNSVFFNLQRRNELRKKLDWENKIVHLYMPTFRGKSFQNTGYVAENEKQIEFIRNSLADLDKKLPNNHLLVLKLHPFLKVSLDFSSMRHLAVFPETEYLTNDILNCADTLITDYSSVMYDFVNTNRKIILWAYDLEQYEKDRGLFETPSELPFVVVRTIAELVEEMKAFDKNIVSRSELLDFCEYDSNDAAEKICQHIILDKKICDEIQLAKSPKDNVLIFGGGLPRNGVTTAFIDLLKKIDSNKRNYTLCFNRWNFTENPLLMNAVPTNYNFVMLSNKGPYTLKEGICLWILATFEKQSRYMTKCFDNLYKRELVRLLVHPHIYDYVLNFEGYQNYNIKLFQRMNCKRILWIHNDMVNLIKTRKDLNYATEIDAYNSYDYFVPITEDIVAPSLTVGCPKDKIKVVHNCFDDVGTKKRALMKIDLQKSTSLRIKFAGGIEEALNVPGIKIINIGRYSMEKEHFRLLDAFELFYQQHKDAILFIIGGHGPLFQKTLAYINKLSCWKNVICIKNIENPLPILKRCDLFVLSSSFEGMPITIKEAEALQVPVVSTDIPGPHSFMKSYNGYLVEETVDALYNGILDFEANNVKLMNIDFDLYNARAIQEFEELFYAK